MSVYHLQKTSYGYTGLEILLSDPIAHRFYYTHGLIARRGVKDKVRQAPRATKGPQGFGS